MCKGYWFHSIKKKKNATHKKYGVILFVKSTNQPIFVGAWKQERYMDTSQATFFWTSVMHLTGLITSLLKIPSFHWVLIDSFWFTTTTNPWPFLLCILGFLFFHQEGSVLGPLLTPFTLLRLCWSFHSHLCAHDSQVTLSNPALAPKLLSRPIFQLDIST